MDNKIITVVGLGLLGGSYAMGLLRANNIVYGIDIVKQSIDFAKEQKYISDGAVENYDDFLGKSDIVILCLYPTATIEWVKRNIHLINKNALITDVSGVKKGLVEQVQEIVKPYGIEFYSAHPMRGKEVLGIKNADCRIFDGGNLILTPTNYNTEKSEKIIIDIAKTLGFANVSKLSLEEHDRFIAYLSQLTHVIAVSLMNSNDNPHIVDYSGDSFRDLTRIAKIDENLWSELFSLNKEALCEQIDIFTENMLRLKKFIKEENMEEMKKMFRISSERRDKFNK